FFATFRIDTRLAPVLTILIGLLTAYFATQIIGNTFDIIDHLRESIARHNPMAFIGYTIYALLSVLVLFIFIRFISQWFVFHRRSFLGFVMKVTNPIMLPVQRLIPPVGMFDISAMLVLLAIGFLQTIVLRIFVIP